LEEITFIEVKGILIKDIRRSKIHWKFARKNIFCCWGCITTQKPEFEVYKVMQVLYHET
jgi:hypothetical protein